MTKLRQSCFLIVTSLLVSTACTWSKAPDSRTSADQPAGAVADSPLDKAKRANRLFNIYLGRDLKRAEVGQIGKSVTPIDATALVSEHRDEVASVLGLRLGRFLERDGGAPLAGAGLGENLATTLGQAGDPKGVLKQCPDRVACFYTWLHGTILVGAAADPKVASTKTYIEYLSTLNP